MQHVKVTITINGLEAGDILMALLADAGYDGFEEAGNELFAYIEEPEFDADDLNRITEQAGVNFQTEVVPAQNWNALWESNFEPVLVDDFCTIRADFHNLAVITQYDIVITPKMSFGTGHHATTQLMILLMKDMSFGGRTVFDFGTGTGVLAILAEMLGAKKVLAIDNDEWSAENAGENIARNNCKSITVQQGSLEDTGNEQVDMILANINRNILLQYMDDLFGKLNDGGAILMSGILAEDEQIILGSATEAGFKTVAIKRQSGWVAAHFNKI